MKLSHRIRQLRYAKGWGPDDLASRASISRTALYQIESGRTELPRAATLRRIARALGVAPEKLLGEEEDLGVEVAEVPAALAEPRPAATMDLAQEIEVERKFRILLRSPLRDAVVRIVEESYHLLPQTTGDVLH